MIEIILLGTCQSHFVGIARGLASDVKKCYHYCLLLQSRHTHFPAPTPYLENACQRFKRRQRLQIRGPTLTAATPVYRYIEAYIVAKMVNDSDISLSHVLSLTV